MRLRTVVANFLTDLVGRELAYHHRPDDERYDQRGQARQHGAQRDIAKDVKRPYLGAQPLRQREQHAVSRPMLVMTAFGKIFNAAQPRTIARPAPCAWSGNL